MNALSSILPAVFAGVAFLAALRLLPILHPTQLWSGSWALGTGLYALRLLPYRSLSWLTAALICGSVLAFALAAPVGSRLARWPRPRSETGVNRDRVELAALLAVGLLLIGLAAFLAHLVAKFGAAHVLRISTEVKVYLSSGEAPLSTIYVDIAVAAATLCGLSAARCEEKRRAGAWLIVAAACSATVYFSTSRAFIAVALASSLAAFAMVRSDLHRRSVAAAALAAVLVTIALFIGLGAVIGKTYGNSTIGDFDNVFARHPAISALALPYEDATASIPALDLLVRDTPTWGYAHGCATAPIACGVLRKLGVESVRVPVAGAFTKPPLPWNAYTFLDRYLIDGGTALALLLVAVTGLAAGYFWTRARKGSTVGVIVYAMSVPALVGAYRNNLVELVFVAGTAAVVMLLIAGPLSRVTYAARRIARGELA